MSGYTPKDVCQYCKCTPRVPCRLEASDECGWIDDRRTVCSNPNCIMQDLKRKRRVPRAKRLTSADVHKLIRGRSRGASDRKRAVSAGLIRPTGGVG